MILKCKNLCIGYTNNIPIIKNLNFNVDNNDYLCIIGENGVGKSTLMKTILGLIPKINGSIKYETISKSDIGYLPQQTEIQKDFPASVFEVVLSGCQTNSKYKFFYNKSDKDLVINNLKKMDIFKLKNKCYRELSGGQQQRVLLARALCATKQCLLLDEPVSGLDPKVTIDMYKLIENLHKEGIAIIMISHDINSALKYANKILYLGNETFFGTTEEFKKSSLGKKFIEV